ncbi:MAG: class I SAM-dependent methyltransferase [Anaerolineales bacterium]|nr:class I SAM-dependent methyltransferase [Anaerolineales bacterium]
MSVRVDPEGYELRRLLAYAGGLADTAVLEVGCGRGRLTFRYAAQAGRVVGIDPDAGRIAQARADTPAGLRSRVTFHAASILDFAPRERFDVAIFAWSL